MALTLAVGTLGDIIFSPGGPPAPFAMPDARATSDFLSGLVLQKLQEGSPVWRVSCQCLGEQSLASPS